MRDTKPLLIALLTVGLVGTWVYHLYDKTQYSLQRTKIYVKDSVAIADAVRDSLRIRYTTTIDSMDNQLVSTQTGNDSLKNELNVTFTEMNQLKSQINNILKNRTVSREDLGIARQKITELQQKVDELNGTNNSISEEKNRLSLQMQQLTTQMESLRQNVQVLSAQNASLSEQVKMSSIFIASEMNLNAVNVRSNKEEETDQVKKADRFVASFVVQNMTNEYSGAEVVVVVLQPDGNVLQISDWNTGNFFETTMQGIKSYTRLVKFDYTKGEQKQIIFSLSPDKFQKGTYKFQVWHKGVMIGEASKSLS
jgi:hypothetical protein